MTPTQRTLQWLRKHGYECEVTEKWVRFPGMKMGVRKDLFGFVDVIAVSEAGCVGVQATSYTNVSARINKINGLPKALSWLKAGNRIAVVGWRKRIRGAKVTYEIRQMEGILRTARGCPFIEWVEARLEEQ